jgi:transcriptional regulator with XRE-family HTH domain
MSRLKELRNKFQYSQIKVQLETGIDQGNYSRMESGEREPTLDQAKALAILYHTSIDYIVGLTDEIEPYPRSK